MPFTTSEITDSVVTKAFADVAANSGSDPDTLVRLVNAFQVVGLVLLVPTLATAALSRDVHRSATWFNYVVSWIVAAVVTLMIVGHQSGPQPEFSVCVVQAAAMYAVPVFNGTTGNAFLLQVYLTVAGMIGHQPPLTSKRVFFFVFVPILSFFAIFFHALAHGLLHKDLVVRDPTGINCHLSDGLATKITASLVLALVVGMFVLGGMIARLLYKNLRVLRQIQRKENNQASPLIAALIRVVVFNFMPMVAIGLSFMSYLPGKPHTFNLVLGILPAAAGLILGTQKDTLRVWMFWRKREPSRQGVPPMASLSAGNRDVERASVLRFEE